jgi:hypothetical protein
MADVAEAETIAVTKFATKSLSWLREVAREKHALELDYERSSG